MRRDRGIALLNALIMVAAISAVAAGLMLRAETSRVRVEDLQISQQAALYLDAAEFLVDPVLRADWERDQNLDHLQEAWARERFDADIDRGLLRGQIRDLQGRFNVNSLSAPSDLAAAQSFERLLRTLGLPVDLGPEIAGYVQARGPVRPGDYAARAVPVRPRGAPMDRIEELRLVRGMTEAYYARLLPFVTALAPGTGLNVNTASAEVLGAVLPTANPAGIARLLAERARLPFETRSDFILRAESLIHPRAIAQAQVPDGGFRVSSNRFEVHFELWLDGRTQSRILTVERSGQTGAARIEYRRAAYP
ncbi:putative type II secretion system protein K [Roseovarius sp. A-2]|uniref:type II secretion system minor pseudopilin GspK n=1 Tax=Roseovarius sp. A-2 TaxID=1570360 RepID=UPI0009D02BC7|nr:type II secretion system minor pseudopilin GspK [Roseovarius sp. A-2]GAW33311.1 putative type II secretion system protein K [Roseovarius sp. A-2]